MTADPTHELAALRASILSLVEQWEHAQSYNRAHMGSMLKPTPLPSDFRRALAATPPADANAPGLREAVEALADDYASDPDMLYRGAAFVSDLRALLVTQPDKAETEPSALAYTPDDEIEAGVERFKAAFGEEAHRKAMDALSAPVAAPDAEAAAIVQMVATTLASSCVADCEDWRGHREEAERIIATHDAAVRAEHGERIAAVWEVVEMYESCGPKQQSTRDVLAAVREALDPMQGGRPENEGSKG